MKQQVVKKAYAKINLGLDVVGKLENGYHLLRTLMQQVDLYDVLTLTPEKEGIFLSTNSEIVAADEDNIAYKAAKKMIEEFSLPGVKIHLEKRIPVAAGMAGGSTDAAAVLTGMNELFELGLPEGKLREIGVSLGADVPFCIMGHSALAEGIGEELTPISGMPEMSVLISKPPIMVSTKYVFEHLDIGNLEHPRTDEMLKAFANGDLDLAISYMGNVLESVTAKKYPIIGELKEKMLALGAKGALMSGSGPTVFGIFDCPSEAEKAEKALKSMYPDVFVQAAGLV